MSGYFILPCIIILVIISGVVFLRNRTYRIKSLAKTKGFSYFARDRVVLRDTIKFFPIYKRGYTRKIINIVFKIDKNIESFIFDYYHRVKYKKAIYKRWKGGPAQTHILLKSNEASFPKLDIHSPRDIINSNKELIDFYQNCSFTDIESNMHTIMLYSEKLKLPVEDYMTKFEEAKHLFELLKEKPEQEYFIK